MNPDTETADTAQNVTAIRKTPKREVGKPRETAIHIEQINRRKGKIWEKLPNESEAHYAHFKLYRDMGPTRTYKRMAELIDKKWDGNLSRIAVEYAWQDRVLAFDIWLNETQSRALETEMQKSAKQWAKRQMNLREEQYQVGLDMLALVKSRLEQALPQIKKAEDGEVTLEGPALPMIIHAGDLPKFARAAVTMMAEAVDLPKSSEDANAVAAEMGIVLPADLSEVSDETLRQHAQRSRG